MSAIRFRCQTCGRHFEIPSSKLDDDQDPICPFCQSQDLELDLSSLFARQDRPIQPTRTSGGNCGSPGPFR